MVGFDYPSNDINYIFFTTLTEQRQQQPEAFRNQPAIGGAQGGKSMDQGEEGQVQVVRGTGQEGGELPHPPGARAGLAQQCSEHAPPTASGCS